MDSSYIRISYNELIFCRNNKFSITKVDSHRFYRELVSGIGLFELSVLQLRLCYYEEVDDTSEESPMIEDLLNELISRIWLT